MGFWLELGRNWLVSERGRGLELGFGSFEVSSEFVFRQFCCSAFVRFGVGLELTVVVCACGFRSFF